MCNPRQDCLSFSNTKTLFRLWTTEHVGLVVPLWKIQDQILENLEPSCWHAEWSECEVQGAGEKKGTLLFLLTKSDFLMLLYHLAVWNKHTKTFWFINFGRAKNQQVESYNYIKFSILPSVTLYSGCTMGTLCSSDTANTSASRWVRSRWALSWCSLKSALLTKILAINQSYSESVG